MEGVEQTGGSSSAEKERRKTRFSLSLFLLARSRGREGDAPRNGGVSQRAPLRNSTIARGTILAAPKRARANDCEECALDAPYAIFIRGHRG